MSTVRASSALFFVDFGVRERTELAPGVVLAPLTAHEAMRITSRLQGPLIPPLVRIEYHLEEPEDGPNGWEAAQRVAEVAHQHAMQLLAIAALKLPYWAVIVVDAWNDEVNEWQRRTYSWDVEPGGRPPGGSRHWEIVELFYPNFMFPGGARADPHTWQVSASEVAAWSLLLERWDRSTRTPRVDLALQYFCAGLGELLHNPLHGFLSGCIALEALLGGSGTEISYRIALRGTSLLPRFPDRSVLFNKLRVVYRMRSRLVHLGEAPEMGTVAWLFAYLRAAIPAASHLIAQSDSHEAALDALDAHLVEPDDGVVRLNEDGWWHEVPPSTLLVPGPHPRPH